MKKITHTHISQVTLEKTFIVFRAVKHEKETRRLLNKHPRFFLIFITNFRFTPSVVIF